MRRAFRFIWGVNIDKIFYISTDRSLCVIKIVFKAISNTYLS